MEEYNGKVIRIIDFRWYKGKYLVGVITQIGNKGVVVFIDACNEVGNKKVGYKKVSFKDIEIINNFRLLEKKRRE